MLGHVFCFHQASRQVKGHGQETFKVERLWEGIGAGGEKLHLSTRKDRNPFTGLYEKNKILVCATISRCQAPYFSISYLTSRGSY